jgi:hypothetical protein
MTDTFVAHHTSLQSPATNAYSATPNDDTDLAFFSRALNVSTSGTVRLTTVGGDVATVFIAAGTAFPIRARRIWATGTTATDIVVLY